jgi:16S rRNA pseudouridine516 synthase
MSKIRLDRLMANLGYGSRKDIARLVADRRVTLHNSVLVDAGVSIALEDVRSGVLRLDNELVDPPAPLHIMLHKPAGYSCSHEEKGALVYDLLPPRWHLRKPALSCAGRLDKDSTGQVILTDDGDLLHRIISPKKHAEKRYAVTLEHALQGNEATQFSSGHFLLQGDDKPLKPAHWLPTGSNSGTMVLHEGRYHQIRRMFEALGNHVIALHRFQTGSLTLEPLEAGKYRQLTAEDVQQIFSLPRSE